LVHEKELAELEKNLPVRHCESCREITTWALVRTERRSGHERRTELPRRRRE
jgi:hypothetical protein